MTLKKLISTELSPSHNGDAHKRSAAALYGQRRSLQNDWKAAASKKADTGWVDGKSETGRGDMNKNNSGGPTVPTDGVGQLQVRAHQRPPVARRSARPTRCPPPSNGRRPQVIFGFSFMWLSSVWLPPLCLSIRQPAAEDVSSFAHAMSTEEVQLCRYTGTVNDLPRGWFVNKSQQCIGKGHEAFERASEALVALECLQLPWLSAGVHDDVLAICSRQFFVLWIMNANRFLSPPQVRNGQCSVTWATTRRHVLCGEERLTVTRNTATDEVFFEVLSFSRPRHLFSWAAYPYVIAQQRRFARDATAVMMRLASSEREPSPGI